VSARFLRPAWLVVVQLIEWRDESALSHRAFFFFFGGRRFLQRHALAALCAVVGKGCRCGALRGEVCVCNCAWAKGHVPQAPCVAGGVCVCGA